MSKTVFLITACLMLIAPLGLNAQTWDPDFRLTEDAGASYTSESNMRCIAVLEDTVHVVWYDYRDGNDEIYYKRSTDAGSSWGTDTRLTTEGGGSVRPSVAVSGSNVHVVWRDDRDGNGEVYYKRSNDGGSTWGADVRLTTDGSVSSTPSMAVFADTVYVTWADNRDGNFEIYFKRSTDGGSTWGADTRLTDATGVSIFCAIAVSVMKRYTSSALQTAAQTGARTPD
jgi:hypothetical protein